MGKETLEEATMRYLAEENNNLVESTRETEITITKPISTYIEITDDREEWDYPIEDMDEARTNNDYLVIDTTEPRVYEVTVDEFNLIKSKLEENVSMKVEAKTLTWNEIMDNAEGTTFGQKALKVKDTARDNVEQLMQKDGVNIEELESVEDAIEEYTNKNNIKFDESGNILNESKLVERKQSVTEYIISFMDGELYDEYDGEFITEDKAEADALFDELKAQHKLNQVDQYIAKTWVWNMSDYDEDTVEVYFNNGDERYMYEESKLVESNDVDLPESFYEKVCRAYVDTMNLEWVAEDKMNGTVVHGYFEDDDYANKFKDKVNNDNFRDIYYGQYTDDYIEAEEPEYYSYQSWEDFYYSYVEDNIKYDVYDIGIEDFYVSLEDLDKLGIDYSEALDVLNDNKVDESKSLTETVETNEDVIIKTMQDKEFLKILDVSPLEIIDQVKLSKAQFDELDKMIKTSGKSFNELYDELGGWNLDNPDKYYDVDNYFDCYYKSLLVTVKVKDGNLMLSPKDVYVYPSDISGEPVDELFHLDFDEPIDYTKIENQYNKSKQTESKYPKKIKTHDGYVLTKVNDGLPENANIPEYMNDNGDVTLVPDVDKYEILEEDSSDKSIWEKVEKIVDDADNDLYPDSNNDYEYDAHIVFNIYRDAEFEDIFVVATYLDGEIQDELDTGDVHLEDLDRTLVDIVKKLHNKQLQTESKVLNNEDVKNLLDNGNVVTVGGKQNYTPTDFYVDTNKIVWYKNGEISFGWEKHPSMNYEDLINHLDKMQKDGFTVEVSSVKPPKVEENKLIKTESNPHRRAVSIKWDVDYDADGRMLPTEVDIPDYIADDDIPDYLSDKYEFCHDGYVLEIVDESKIIKTEDVDINNDESVYVDQKEELSDGRYHMRLVCDGYKMWINVGQYKGNGVVQWDYDFDSPEYDVDAEDYINSSVDVNDIEEAILKAILTKKTEGDNPDVEKHVMEYLESNQIYPSDVFTADDRVMVDISWGDWKHDHIRCDKLMENLGYTLVEEEVTEEDGSDCYSAIRHYIPKGSITNLDESVDTKIAQDRKSFIDKWKDHKDFKCSWCGTKFTGNIDDEGRMPNCPHCMEDRYAEDENKAEDGHANKDVHFCDSTGEEIYTDFAGNIVTESKDITLDNVEDIYNNLSDNLKNYIENTDNVPTKEIDGTKWFDITAGEKEQLEKFIEYIDSIPEDIWRTWDEKTKLDMSSYANNAERLCRNCTLKLESKEVKTEVEDEWVEKIFDTVSEFYDYIKANNIKVMERQNRDGKIVLRYPKIAGLQEGKSLKVEDLSNDMTEEDIANIKKAIEELKTAKFIEFTDVYRNNNLPAQVVNYCEMTMEDDNLNSVEGNGDYTVSADKMRNALIDTLKWFLPKELKTESALGKFKKNLQSETGWEDAINPDWEDDIESAFYQDSNGQGFSTNIIEAMHCENKNDVIKLIDMLMDKLNLKESKEVKVEAIEKDYQPIDDLKIAIAKKRTDDMLKAVGRDNFTGVDEQRIYRNVLHSLDDIKAIDRMISDYDCDNSNKSVRMVKDLNDLKAMLTKKTEAIEKEGPTYNKLCDEIKFQAEENNIDITEEQVKKVADKICYEDKYFFSNSLPEDGEDWSEVNTYILQSIKTVLGLQEDYKSLDKELDKLIDKDATDKELNDFIEKAADDETITNNEYTELVKKAQDTRRIDEGKSIKVESNLSDEIANLDTQLKIIDLDIKKKVKQYTASQKRYHGDNVESDRLEAEIDSLELEQKRLQNKLNELTNNIQDDPEYKEYVVTLLKDGAIDDPKYVQGLTEEEFDNLVTNTWMKDVDLITSYMQLDESKSIKVESKYDTMAFAQLLPMSFTDMVDNDVYDRASEIFDDGGTNKDVVDYYIDMFKGYIEDDEEALDEFDEDLAKKYVEYKLDNVKNDADGFIPTIVKPEVADVDNWGDEKLIAYIKDKAIDEADYFHCDATKIIDKSLKALGLKESKLCENNVDDTNIENIKDILVKSGISNERTLDLMSKDVLNTLKSNYAKDCSVDGVYYGVAITDAIQKVIERITGSKPKMTFTEGKSIKVESTADFYDIVSVTPEYTGGGVYVYIGELTNGNYFIATDQAFAGDSFDIRILNKDPNENNMLDDVKYQEECLVEDLDEAEAKEFTIYMLNWIIENQPEGNYQIDDIKDMLNAIYQNRIDESKESTSRYSIRDYADTRDLEDDESQYAIYDAVKDDFYYDEAGNNPVFDDIKSAQAYVDKLNNRKTEGKSLKENATDDRFNSTISRWENLGYKLYKQESTITVLVNDNDEEPKAIAFNGKASKPIWHYRFRSMEELDNYVNKSIENAKGREQSKADRKAQRRLTSEHDIKVGDIFYTSWGYDQTNTEFYEVVNVRGSRIDLKEIGYTVDYEKASYGREDITPVPHKFVNDEVYTVSARADGTVTDLDGKDFLNLYKYTGGSHEVTATGWGH